MTKLSFGLAMAVAVIIAVTIVLGVDGTLIAEAGPGLVETIEGEEGFCAKPCLDSRGGLEIGYGTNLDIGITKAEGAFLLRSRLDRVKRDLPKAWPPFTAQPDHVKDALTDMAYQLGVAGVVGQPLVTATGLCDKPRDERPAGCGFHDMLAALARGDIAGAVQAGEESAWHRETPKRAARVLSALRGS